MASPSVEKSLAATVGKVDYNREQRFYEIISETLAGGSNPPFAHGSAWTFNKTEDQMIDEYIVDYEEALEAGRMSLMGKATFSKRNRMRYRFMMQLFGLRLDKKQWERDFGCTVAAGLPVEYAFMKAAGAFDRDDAEQITLTPKGRYLMVVMMRQFFIGVNNLRDQARAALPADERDLLFGAGCAMK